MPPLTVLLNESEDPTVQLISSCHHTVSLCEYQITFFTNKLEWLMLCCIQYHCV